MSADDRTMPISMLPADAHNRALIQNVHPPSWTNPHPKERYDLVVIGAGTAGLVTAAGAAGLGATVALIEKKLLGGDCLNFGCVPSKALLRSARAMADVRQANSLGITVPEGVRADFGAVMERLRRLRARISHHDAAARFQGLGVDVYFGQARFVDVSTIEVEGRRLQFRKAVIATGARAAIPSIPGLAEAGYLTNETVFDLTELPRRLAVVGGGPIGCELAQAFQRLGASVVLLHKNARLLDKEDPEATAIVQRAFDHEGVRLVLNGHLNRVEERSDGKAIYFRGDTSGSDFARVDQILVAIGRTPNVEGLNLEGAGVEYDSRRGVHVNDQLRTTHPRIYAVGDICLPWKFTHAADAAARIVIQNALFLGRKRVSSLTIPRCTYTDPEIACVGFTELEAQEQGLAISTFLRPFDQVDRAIVDGESEGFVKVHVRKGTDRIIGATIVARHAGEMISEITLAMRAKMGLGSLANVVHPYPTQAEAIRQTGDAFNRTRLTPFVKRLLSLWLKLSR